MKQAKPSIERLIEFHELLNSFAEIERIVHIKRRDSILLESDTEHSYNLAMMAWFLSESFSDLNKGRVVQLALVHDLVEIHAGDTFAFADQAELDSKAAREAAAQKQLLQDWPGFSTLHDTINEYESLASPEANFVYALDKLMPIFAIYLSAGITWHEKQLSLARLNSEKRQKMAKHPAILEYWDDMYTLLLDRPDLFPTAS